MRLATIRTPDGANHTAAVRIDEHASDDASAVEVGPADVGELLADPRWRERAQAATGRHHRLSEVEFAPLIVRPEKIIGVGLNYRSHVLETGNEIPEYPTLFAKSSDRRNSSVQVRRLNV